MQMWLQTGKLTKSLPELVMNEFTGDCFCNAVQNNWHHSYAKNVIESQVCQEKF